MTRYMQFQRPEPDGSGAAWIACSLLVGAVAVLLHHAWVLAQ